MAVTVVTDPARPTSVRASATGMAAATSVQRPVDVRGGSG